ncbi:MAG TPA: preprotein translocase subunit YajC [Acidimicrobiia bacterium]|nr:preprotein translocase subunit YajC [Acidimicrobiia bacterium]
MGALIPLAVLVVAFFVLIVVPQRRRNQARQALMASLEVGQDVVTVGGIHGTIRSLGDTTLELEIAPGVVITTSRGAIGQRVTPTLEDAGDTGDENDAVDGGDAGSQS